MSGTQAAKHGSDYVYAKALIFDITLKLNMALRTKSFKMEPNQALSCLA